MVKTGTSTKRKRSQKSMKVSEDKIAELEDKISELSSFLKKERYSTSHVEPTPELLGKQNLEDSEKSSLIRRLEESEKRNQKLEYELEELKKNLSVNDDGLGSFEKWKSLHEKTKAELQEKKEENRHLLSQVSELKSQLDDQKRMMGSFNNSKRYVDDLKRQLKEVKEENKQLQEHVNELKSYIKQREKAVSTGQYQKKIKERDEVIKKLNDQLSLLKKEKNLIDQANMKLLSQIDSMQADIKKLEMQVETKEKETADVRKMLENQKQLSEMRMKNRLRSFAENETKKHIMLATKVKELMDVVEKQREVIEKINQADLSLYEQFNNTINQIKENRNSIDYSVVRKKIDEVNVDIASVSDLLSVSQTDVSDAIQKSSSDDENYVGPSEDIGGDEKIRNSVRRGLESGDRPEMIKNNLIEEGEDEALVSKIIDEEMDELNIKT